MTINLKDYANKLVVATLRNEWMVVSLVNTNEGGMREYYPYSIEGKNYSNDGRILFWEESPYDIVDIKLAEEEPEPETLTLKQLLKKWEFDFSAKWENPKNRTNVHYEEEVERFIQMFMEWLPDAVDDNVLSEWDRGCNSGFNRYRKILMGKLK